MVLLQIKLYFPKNPEGSNIFRVGGGGWGWGGGLQLFPGVVQMLFPIESHITCDFPGRVLAPYPPSGSAHDLSFFKHIMFS